jgi:hypothetical protein
MIKPLLKNRSILCFPIISFPVKNNLLYQNNLTAKALKYGILKNIRIHLNYFKYF